MNCNFSVLTLWFGLSLLRYLMQDTYVAYFHRFLPILTCQNTELHDVTTVTKNRFLNLSVTATYSHMLNVGLQLGANTAQYMLCSDCGYLITWCISRYLRCHKHLPKLPSCRHCKFGESHLCHRQHPSGLSSAHLYSYMFPTET